MWKEFKEFAFKGNVMDLAVGVLIGGAFSKIVTSIVNDLLMPIFGFITAGREFKSLKWVLSEAVVKDGAVVKPEAAILYGSFIQNVVDFFIIASSIFIFIKLINKAKDKLIRDKEADKAEEAVEVKAPTTEDLLAEIRDLLKKALCQ